VEKAKLLRVAGARRVEAREPPLLGDVADEQVSSIGAIAVSFLAVDKVIACKTKVVDEDHLLPAVKKQPRNAQKVRTSLKISLARQALGQ